MGRHSRVFTENEISGIIKLYQNNMSIVGISNQYTTRKESIRKILKDNDIPKKRNFELYNNEGFVVNQKYSLDRDYFENIDSANKAYWLGFIFADGNVYFRKCAGTLTITLQHSDISHLSMFLKCIKSNNIIKTVTHGEFKYCNLIVCNTKLCEDLTKLGCIPKKSLMLQSPKINNQFLVDFIRGYFDGDGCFSYYIKGNTKSFECNFLGTYNLMNYFKLFLEENGIKASPIVQVENIYKIRITNRNNLKLFYDFIYSNNENCYLERKFNKMKQYLELIN